MKQCVCMCVCVWLTLYNRGAPVIDHADLLKPGAFMDVRQQRSSAFRLRRVQFGRSRVRLRRKLTNMQWDGQFLWSEPHWRVCGLWVCLGSHCTLQKRTTAHKQTSRDPVAGLLDSRFGILADFDSSPCSCIFYHNLPSLVLMSGKKQAANTSGDCIQISWRKY